MKERPILMTPANAQQCFDGEKTQTRIIIKPQPDESFTQGYVGGIADREMRYTYGWSWRKSPMHQYHAIGSSSMVALCPYGIVGDRLWVRENGWERPARTPKMLRDGADTWERFYFDALLDAGEAEELKGYGFKRRPSIHMPRWACRTVLDITDVRVERIQDITQLGALEEGCEGPDHKATFFHRWSAIYGANAWNTNPWVWVISFKKIEGGGQYE